MPVTVLVDAFSNPTTASKLEAEIGALMQANERKAGHKPMLPSFMEKREQVLKVTRRMTYPFDSEVMSYLRSHPGAKMADVTAGTTLTKSQAISVMHRLVLEGRVRKQALHHNSALTYYLTNK